MKNVDPTHFKHSLHLPFHRLTPLHPSPLYTHTFPLSESIPIHATASHVLNGTLISILVRIESHLFPSFSILFFPFFRFPLFLPHLDSIIIMFLPCLFIPTCLIILHMPYPSRHTPLVSFRISIRFVFPFFLPLLDSIIIMFRPCLFIPTCLIILPFHAIPH